MKQIIFFMLLSSLLFAQEGTKNLEEVFQTAIFQHNSGKYEDAIKNYNILLEFNIDKEVKRQILIKKGLAENSLGNYDLAIMIFTETIKLDSTDLASFVDRGLSYYYKKDFTKAEEDFLFVKNKNQNPKMTENATYWLSKIEFLKGNYKKAIYYCDEMISKNKDDAEFYFLRGIAYSNLGDYENAIKSYDSAIKLHENYVEAITNRGVAKINLINGKGRLNHSNKETKNACKDLQKAHQLGDVQNTEDLIYIYCK